MRRRHLLSLPLAATAGLEASHAGAKTVAPPTLESLCEHADMVAWMENFHTEEVDSSEGDCGPRTRGSVLQMLRGSRRPSFEWWRGHSVYRELSFVIFLKRVSVNEFFEGDIKESQGTEAEKTSMRKLVEACNAVQPEWISLYALPTLARVDYPDNPWVRIERDDEGLSYFAPTLKPHLLRRNRLGWFWDLKSLKAFLKDHPPASGPARGR